MSDERPFDYPGSLQGDVPRSEREERWTGPYRYLEMTFHEQNRALAINSPLTADYERGALYDISDQGNVRISRPA